MHDLEESRSGDYLVKKDEFARQPGQGITLPKIFPWR